MSWNLFYETKRKQGLLKKLEVLTNNINNSEEEINKLGVKSFSDLDLQDIKNISDSFYEKNKSVVRTTIFNKIIESAETGEFSVYINDYIGRSTLFKNEILKELTDKGFEVDDRGFNQYIIKW